MNFCILVLEKKTIFLEPLDIMYRKKINKLNEKFSESIKRMMGK
jgi:hypothetical protein